MPLTWARNGLWAVIVLLVGGGAAYALLVGKPEPEPEPPTAIAPPLVEVMFADPRQRALSVQTQGTVRPQREIELVSRVSGRVERVAEHFAEGGFVAADEELVKIEDVDYELAIVRAQSQVAAAEQRLAEERGRARQARREWRELGSEEANALFLRRPQIAAAQASLESARADLQAARLDLERTSVVVPFNGRVSQKHVDIGQFVSPGTPIASVYSTEVVEVRLPLTGGQVALLDLPLTQEDNAAARDQGPPVTLRARFANREWEWRGRVVRTAASMDENSRVVFAVAEVHKPFARDIASERPPLLPGLFVDAAIGGRPLPGVSRLPRSALRSDGSVTIVDGKRRTRVKSVRVLDSDPGIAWVQGLEAGDRVVVREPGRLVAGTEVRVKTAAELAGGGAVASGEGAR